MKPKYVTVQSLLLIIMFLLLTASLALAAGESVAPSASQQNGKPQIAGGAKSSQNQIALAASQAGVVTCLPRINQIASFITADAPAGGILFVAPSEINKKQLSVSLEVNNPNSSLSSYVSTNFSPATDGGCSGSYEVVNFWLSPCEELAKNVFTTFKPTGRPLRQQITVLENGPFARVFLMPAAGGCVSIKKEAIY